MLKYFSLLCFLISWELVATHASQAEVVTRHTSFERKGERKIFHMGFCEGNNCVVKIYEPIREQSERLHIRHCERSEAIQ